MDNLLKIAERCEAATGPDRELDELISAVIQDAVREVQGDGRTAYHSLDGSRWVSIAVGSYTASLDAAMTLVPEGLSVALYVHPDESHADVYRLHPSKGRLGEAEQAKSPALAICAAALRARSSVTEKRG